MTEESSVERLMSVLITKMEGMDSDLALLKAENERLRGLIASPKGLFRKAGFVPVTTPYTDDLMPDPSAWTLKATPSSRVALLLPFLNRTKSFTTCRGKTFTRWHNKQRGHLNEATTR